ncbi:MAG: DNA gyrase subunit A [Oscillospiraceae bacterium]|nr:DNA gyrase subunit A [Oscillospiraceae bacterium]
MVHKMDEQNTQFVSKVINVDLNKEMKKSFLEYSMSVIVARALPDVRDGLKPVHRRILYTMHENNLTPDKAYRKCADTVGSVLGRYHPHGDASVYDAMVRMAQDFSLRYPLVDGHGNFGSIDGHPAAAYRYTEARMSRMSLDMLADIDKETVNFQSNYDDRLKEPSVLPSRFPNLLVNGSTGIAVGMATNIPPHNLREVIDGICLLIEDPEASMPDIMEVIKGPDFPTGGVIMGYAGIRAAYATGRGRVIVRARAEIEESHKDRFRIVISEIPYMVNKLNLVKSIIELSDDKRIEGIADVVDHSSREGMRIVIDLKRDANPQVVLNQLYTYTQMQSTFGVIMLSLVNGIPRILTLKQMLEEYIKFQCEVITRRTLFELRKAKERAHIMEALKIASDFIDEVINIIRSSRDIPLAKEHLIERFSFDDIQADAIVKMRLGQLAGLERQKIEDELGLLLARIAELEEMLSDEDKIKEIVKDECLKMRDKYGDERRTEISPVSGEVDIEDLIPIEESVLTLTHNGYIKRQAVDVYKAQRRGGRGIMGMTTREEDFAETMFICSSHDYVMFFTSAGRVYRRKCYEVPEGGRTAKGINVVNLLPLEAEEKVTAMIHVSEFEQDKYLCMVTRKGIIKRSRLSAYSNARKNGLIAVTLDDGDELVWVRVTDGYQSLIVGTRMGKAIHFDENNARVIGRTARGVKAIELAEGDEVIGMSICRENGLLLTVSDTGFGRLSEISDYRLQSRGGKGLINYHTQRFGEVAAIKVVDPSDDIILIASDGIIIRMAASEIRLCRRPSKGVIVMRLEGDARIVSLARAPLEEDDDEDQPREAPQLIRGDDTDELMDDLEDEEGEEEQEDQQVDTDKSEDEQE